MPTGAAGLTLVLGGTRSGKSAFAEGIVAHLPGPPTYLATGSPVDDDMAARIAGHRARRGAGWATIEAGPDLAAALGAVGDGPVLVDALGTWVAAHWSARSTGSVARPAEGEASRELSGRTDVSVCPFPVDIEGLVAALVARSGPTVVVSDEVGLGVHPSTEAGRHFRDALGLVNQAVAAVADDVWLVVAGRGLRLEAP